jgi:hypothetical protein
MRARVLISFVVVLFASVALVSASGAATTKAQKVTRIDVSTRLAVIHYLRSIHVNPKGAVIQRGVRNYAGAHCPGKGWTCASTKHTVVQIARHGGKNRFRCSSSHCVVVQISGVARGVYVPGRQLASTGAKGGGGSTATCIKTGSGATTGTGQTCTISQSGSGPNTAGVYENTQKVSGLTQTAQYTASITQTSASGANKACVTQNINLDGSTSNTNGKLTTANLQAYQTITITQNSSTGANYADQSSDSSGNCTGTTITQSQTLTSTVSATGPISQLEDATVNKGPNVLLDIEQNQGQAYSCQGSSTGPCGSSGTNDANFTQTSNQSAVANSPKGSVAQTQSSVTTGTDPNLDGGILAGVNQDSGAKSTFTANQQETQCEDASTGTATTGLTTCSTTPPDTKTLPANLTQNQYGPAGVGGNASVLIRTREGARVPARTGKGPGDSNQRGFGGDSYGVTQHSTQYSDLPSGQQNSVTGGVTSSGGGLITENTLIDGNGKSDVQGGANPNAFINCTGSNPKNCTKSLSAPVIDPSSEPTNPGFDNPTFTFTNVDPSVTFQCSTDGTTFTPCDPGSGPGGSGSAAYTDLPAGPTTFYVESVDPDNGDASTPATFSWTVLPLGVFALGTDGSSAGWECQPGGPIKLQVGTDPGTYAVISIDNAGGTAIDSLEPPSFTADNYLSGSPRLVIDLSNGHQLIGYPGISALNGADMAWSDSAIDSGNTYHPWSVVQSFETGAGTTVSDAFVVADASQWEVLPPQTPDYGPDNISDLTWAGTDFNSGTCSG